MKGTKVVAGWPLAFTTALFTALFVCMADGAVKPKLTKSPAPVVSAPATNPPSSTPYHVTERGANHQVWQRETYVKLPGGHVVPRIHRYTEVASGLNYQNAKGEWVDSKEIIEAYPKGAIARQGQYQVIFASNLNSSGAIDLQSADGKRLRSNILGLIYHDQSTGDAVLIAKVQNSTGTLIANNQVLYANAFAGVKADVRYTYRRGSFEQDVILREQLPTPESCGLNPNTTELQVMTEFLNPPKEILKERKGRQGLKSDQDISWGSTYIGRGRAFDLEGRNSGKPANVSKELTNINGRRILLEKVTVKDIQAGLGRLPLHAGVKSKLLKTAFNNLTLPATPSGNASSGPMMLAQSAPAKDGYVLDYIALNANQTNFTFQADMTYFVNGNDNLYGNTIIEGGAIIKFDTNSDCSLNVLDTIDCQTSAYRPAIFTSYNDSTVGESVGGSGSAACSGTLALHIANDLDSDIQIYVYDDYGNYVATWDTVSAHGSSDYSFTAGLGQHYAFDSYDTTDWNEYYTDFWPTLNNGTIEVHPDSSVTFSETGDALCTLPPAPSTTALSLLNGGDIHNVRISNLGIGISSSAHYTVTDAQFANCGTALQAENTYFYAGNILMSGVGTAFSGQNFQGNCEQLTLDQGALVTDDPDGVSTSSSLTLANSLVTTTGSYGVVPVTTNYVATLSSSSGIYQVVGGGGYYLAAASPYRDVGTTAIDPGTLADIQGKTTYPPIVYAGTGFTTAQTFSPQAQRDADVPDLGYHYDPLDYVFGGCDLFTNLMLTAGTAIGWYQDYGSVGSSGQPYGLSLNDGANLISAGTAAQPCWITHYALVQEAVNGAWNNHGWMSGLMFNGSGAPAIPQLNAQFTKWSVVPGLVGFYRDNWSYGVAKAANCEYYGEGMGSVAGYLTMYYTNCLFFRTFIGLDAQAVASSFTLQNCTFYNGFIAMGRHTWQPAAYWTVENTAFDGTGFQFDDDYAGASYTTFDYNAYNTNNLSGLTYGYPWGPILTEMEIMGAHSLEENGFNWQSSWLGDFYLPSDSPLIDAGSANANLLGLYYFTTQTGQAEETASIADIGYHYVAIDPATGQPYATFTNGSPDYLLDTHGTGLPDWWLLEYFGNYGHFGSDLDDLGFTLLADFQNGTPPNMDSDADGLPDWWEMYWFGSLDAQGTDLDANGHTILHDYHNGSDPNVIGFQIALPGPYVSTNKAVITITPYAGHPAFMAVLVNDDDEDDAVWQPYVSNYTVDLADGDGSYDILVGLKGPAPEAQTSWQEGSASVYAVPFTLTITNPVTGTVSAPLVQIQGYASTALSLVTFDVSNAAGIFTNQTGYLTGTYFDPSLLAPTAGYFSCYDVLLTNGLNTVTIYATDLSGNTLSNNFNYTLDYSADTTAPAVSLVWPTDGSSIGGSNTVIQAHVDDINAVVTAMIVDAGGHTNTVSGLVGRDGTVWFNNAPLAGGANAITLTATDAAGNHSDTTLAVTASDVGLTMDPLPGDQFNLHSVNVTGNVGDASYSVTVNGVAATVSGDPVWSADAVPVNDTGTASFYVEVRDGDGNLVATQTFYQAQPAKVELREYIEHSHQDAYTINEAGRTLPGHNDVVVNWDAVDGGFIDSLQDVAVDGDYGGKSTWFTTISGGEEDALAGVLGLEDEFFWHHAQVSGYTVTGPDQGSTGSAQIQSTVSIVPNGQNTVGSINIYLVSATANELSDPGFDNAYNEGDHPLPPDWLQIQRKTLVPAGFTNEDGTIPGCAIVSGPSDVNVDVTPTATETYFYDDYTFDVNAWDITHIISVDNNRDGKITADEADATSRAEPFRFWINDSKEHGDDESAAGGGDDQIPGSSSPNYASNHPQGRSDYVNFFPVALCLSNVLQMLPPTNGFEYRLSQADAAVKIIYTDLAPAGAFDYLTNSTGTADYATIAGYDPSFAPNSSGAISLTTLDQADLVAVTSTGLILNTNWLAEVQAGGGTGIILADGCASTTKPLWLEIWRAGHFIGSVPLYLSLTGVESMFRHLNLSAHGNGDVAVASRAEAPNEPLTNGKNLLFLHGYNVNQQQARGFQSEMFKRFYWSGSKARFYGVTWNGSVSQNQIIPGVSCNLQTNIVTALLTSPYLAEFINDLPGSTAVAAHSLGNLVVLSAISDHGAKIDKYFMIDCAVAMEALDGTISNSSMIYPEWSNYNSRLWANQWSRLFPGDARGTLTWRDRLSNLSSAGGVYNFYSSGEEVLRTFVGTPPDNLASSVFDILDEMTIGTDKAAYAWVWQEKNKGRMSDNNFISSNHGGWRFNDGAYGTNTITDPAIEPLYTHMSPSAADGLLDSELEANPFFNLASYAPVGMLPDAKDTALLGAGGAAYAAANRDRILSDAIPALSLPVGANSVDILTPDGEADHNYNLSSTTFENGWVSGRPSGEDGKWHHSDFDHVAYPFNYKLYKKMSDLGGLK